MKAESAFHDLSSVHLMSYHMHMPFYVVYCEISVCVMECILKISFMHCTKLFWEKPRKSRKAIHDFIYLCKCRPCDKPEVATVKSWFLLVIWYVFAVDQRCF